MSKSGGFRELVEASHRWEYQCFDQESLSGDPMPEFAQWNAALAAARVEAVEELIKDAREIAEYDPDTTNEAQPDIDELIGRLRESLAKLEKGGA